MVPNEPKFQRIVPLCAHSSPITVRTTKHNIVHFVSSKRDTVELQNLPLKNLSPPSLARVRPLSAVRKTERILCPSDDETTGSVEVAWLGPACSESKSIIALTVLFDYLTDSAVAPLQKDFVQITDPLCTAVNFSIRKQRDCELIASFEGVPVKKLGSILQYFFDKTVADHKISDVFDVEIFILFWTNTNDIFAMNAFKLENNPMVLVSPAVISHQLLGEEDDPNYDVLKKLLDPVDILQKLKAETVKFWHDLFCDWLTEKCVCVEAEPSKETAKSYEDMEEERIKQKMTELGEKGLLDCAQQLEEAINQNSRVYPLEDELSKRLIVHDIQKNLDMIGVSTSTNVVANLSDEFVDKFNFATILHYVPSDFFDVNIVFDTEAIPKDLLMFLPLWFQLIDHSPVNDVNGRKQSCKIIAKQATRDLVSHSVSVGISGHYDRYVCFRLRTVAHNACNLAKWAKTYIHDIIFREHRLVIAAKNLSKSAAAVKQNGLAVCQFMSSAISQVEFGYNDSENEGNSEHHEQNAENDGCDDNFEEECAIINFELGKTKGRPDGGITLIVMGEADSLLFG